MIAENTRTTFELGKGLLKPITAIKDIITEDERDGVLTDEGFGNDKSLGDAAGPGLFAIINGQAPGSAVAEQLAKTGQVLGCRDKTKLPHAAFDQSRQWIIHHRFVINWLELFACHQ